MNDPATFVRLQLANAPDHADLRATLKRTGQQQQRNDGDGGGDGDGDPRLTERGRAGGVAEGRVTIRLGGRTETEKQAMPRKVGTLLAARPGRGNGGKSGPRREESADPVVAKHAAALARDRQQRRGRRQEGSWPVAEHARWLDQATADLFARLDERRTAPSPETDAGFVAALRALAADHDSARFVAQRLELDPVDVRRLVGPLDVS